MECIHHWIVESPDEYEGRDAHGICKHCRAERDFPKSQPEWSASDRATTGFARQHQPGTRLPYVGLAEDR